MTCGAGLALLGRGGREFAFTGSSDPYWADVLLLLHFNGADASTTFTDSSSYNRTLTIFDGTPELDTAQSMFGSSASLYGGTGNVRIRWDISGAEWDAPNWTFECFYRRTAAAGSPDGILYYRTGLGLQVRNSPYDFALTDTFSILADTVTQTVLGTWCHLAVSVQTVGITRTAYLFIDGVLEDTYSVTNSSLELTSSATPAEIGRTSDIGFAQLYAHLDEVRITAACRYTATFTVPAEAYPDYDEAVVTPPPTTIPPVTYTDAYWASVLFLSAMDLTKVNDKTGIAYTLDSAAVTATDPFDGAGALACAYPPSAPTSTPFDPASSMTFAYTSTGLTIEFWLRVDSWTEWTSGAYKWANLCQVDNAFDADAPNFALALADELVDGEVVPCFQVYGYHRSSLNGYVNYTLVKEALRAAVDGAWHNVTIAFRYYSPFARWNATLYIDGAEQTTLLASPGSPRFSGVVVPPNKVGQGAVGFVYTSPISPAITPTTFAGAIDEIRITAADRYDEWSPFVVPHYAFPRS